MRRQTGFSGKYPNVHLTIIYIPIVFALASLIDAVESRRSQNLIKDKIQGGGNPTQATSKLNGIKQGLMLRDIQNVG